MQKAAIKKVVIPVAGLGTRSLPFTKVVPKELVPVLSTPTIHFIVEEVVAAGIEQVIFVTSSGKTALEDYFDVNHALVRTLRERGKEDLAACVEKTSQLCEVISVRQKEPLGLGHAVLCAAPVIGGEPFAVALGDEIFPPWDPKAPQSPLAVLAEQASKTAASVIGVMKVPRERTASYGIVDVGAAEVGTTPVPVKATVEKPRPEKAPSEYAIVGRYAFGPEILDCLKSIKPGIGGEIQLTDAMSALAAEGSLYASAVQGCRYDMGSLLGYVSAQIDAGLREPSIAGPLKDYLRTLL
ncbi:MAG: UTP--glucose-1-phosphate uridylyltransferase [Bdellovibrionales bacterium]|nr:UTP--glucose-1-phosphate uridylyltransferase [Bdellovibrionales bacterium]